MIAGFVQQGAPDAAFGGELPLHFNVFNGHVTLDGGVTVATTDVPGTGTRANVMTRAQFVAPEPYRPCARTASTGFWRIWPTGRAERHARFNGFARHGVAY